MSSKGLQKAGVIRKFEEGAKTTVARRASTRSGSEVVRITAAAKKEIVETVEAYLEDLGDESRDMLALSKKKTVDKRVLMAVAKKHCHFKDQAERVIRTSAARDKRTIARGAKGRARPHRRAVAVEGASRVFGRGLPLGRKGYNVSPAARVALATLAEQYAVALGAAAGEYANAAKGATIKSDYVSAAAGCL